MNFSSLKRLKYINRNTKLKWALRLLFVLVVLLLVLLIRNCSSHARDRRIYSKLQNMEVPYFVQQELLPENANSRNGLELETVRNIVIHYVANPGSTAMQNRDYFAAEDTVVNSHFIVGIDGEIIQCIPLNEQSVASNWRNSDTISIEVCHPDESGKFTKDTMKSLVKLTTWLLIEFELEAEDVIRHYDITGKLCPLYYVENEDEWAEFLEEVDSRL